MDLYKIVKVIAFILGALGAVALAILLFKGDAVVIETGEGLDWFLFISYITFFATIALVLLFVFKDLFTSASIKSTLLSIGLFLAVFIFSYIIAKGEDIVMPDGSALAAGDSRMISTGLIAFYVLGIGALVTMLVSEIKNLTISK